MKSKLLAIGFALAAFPAIAQNHADNYNRSAFSNSGTVLSGRHVDTRLVQQKVQQHFPGMSANVDQISGSFTDLFGAALNIPGSNLTDKVQYCFTHHLSDFGLDMSQWQQTRNFAAPRAGYISFEQYIGGRKVIFSRLNFRFTNDGRLQRIQMKHYGAIASLLPALSVQDAKSAATQDIAGVSITETAVDNNWVWFPVPSAQGYTLRPAYSFEAKGTGKNLPLDLSGYVDAISGEVLYRTNKVKETVDLTVKGTVYAQNPLAPATDEVLPNLAITVNSVPDFTDAAGMFSSAGLSAPIMTTIKLQGKWSKVNAVLSANVTPSFNDTLLLSSNTLIFPTTSPSSSRHVNAYYHVNRVHDFMKGYYPAFTMMDFMLPTNVDVTGSCNAFYNGTSINFYVAGSGCNSFALCGDIIYHEYGHGISDKFYDDQGAGTLNNGALNEGNSDIWGISITHDPVLGKGSMPGPNGYIRRYDQAPKVYPADIEGEVHADGEIIAGAWWDVAVNINPDTMTQLFTQTYYDTPDGPDGTEGEVYHQVLISALMADDDDNNLNNGTPHFMQIIMAFAKHGIYLLGDASVTHTELAHQPANTPITINAQVTVSTPIFLKTVRLYYRSRTTAVGGWDSLSMVNTGGTNYSAQIPGVAEGSMVDYYFAIYDTLSYLSAYSPVGYNPVNSTHSNIPYQFGVGVGKTTGFDFETPATDWTIGGAPGDNATAGIWIAGTPIGSYLNSATGNIWVQTNADHTTGTGKCLLTGNATTLSTTIGSADVDNGVTTVISPVFNISAFAEPIMEYYRWYCNDKGSNPGQDYWRVQIKDSAASAWIKDVDYTYQADNRWRRRIFNVKQYLGTSTAVMMRFVARDDSPGSAVEAAVDDIFMYDKASALGVSDIAASLKAVIYPNPAQNVVRVHLPKAAAGSISLYDLAGKQLMNLDMNGTADNDINIFGIPAGTYFIMVRTDKMAQSHKLTVVR